MSTITLTLDLETTPADAVAEVLRILQGGKVAETVTPAAATPAPVKPKKEKKEEPAPQTADSTSAAPADTDPFFAMKADEKLSALRLKQVELVKGGKREVIKSLLEKFATDSLTNLPVEKYDAYFTELKSL